MRKELLLIAALLLRSSVAVAGCDPGNVFDGLVGKYLGNAAATAQAASRLPRVVSQSGRTRIFQSRPDVRAGQRVTLIRTDGSYAAGTTYQAADGSLRVRMDNGTTSKPLLAKWYVGRELDPRLLDEGGRLRPGASVRFDVEGAAIRGQFLGVDESTGFARVRVAGRADEILVDPLDFRAPRANIRETPIRVTEGDLVTVTRSDGSYAVGETFMAESKLWVSMDNGATMKPLTSDFYVGRALDPALLDTSGRLRPGSNVLFTLENGTVSQGQFTGLDQATGFARVEVPGRPAPLLVDPLEFRPAPAPRTPQVPRAPPAAAARRTPSGALHAGPDPAAHASRVESLRLQPSTPVRVGSESIRVGEIFPVGGGRYAVLMEVEVNGQKHLRAAYRSNSQASWRVLPSYVVENGWFDKSVGEQALGLPREVEKLLSTRLFNNQVRNDVGQKEGFELLTGAVRRIQDFGEYARYSQSADNLSREVRVSKLVSISDSSVRSGSIPPSRVRIDSPQSQPDFSRLVDQYRSTSNTAGNIDVLVYRSRDGSIEYSVFRDSQNRIWFGGARRSTSGLSSYGVHAEAVELGPLGAPLWEYHSQIPRGLAGRINPRNSSYADYWQGLRQMPDIRRWYEANRIPIPE